LFSIENISIKEYFELQDSSKYDIFIDTLTPDNIFSGKRFDANRLTLDEVHVITQILKYSNIDKIKGMYIELFKLGSFEISAEKEFYNTSVFDLFRTKKYINDFINNLVDTENKLLKGVPDEKLIRIGAAEKLAPVSFLLTKMRLAEQFCVSPKEVGNWNYNYAFSLMIANKKSNDIQREYAQLK